MGALKTVFGVVLLCVIPRVAICASVRGTVSDAKDHTVSGAEITLQSSAGKVFGRATSDLQGHYQISGLKPDTYQFILNPLATGFKAGSGVSHLDSEGLTINWKVSTDARALALASPNTTDQIAGDPFGYSPAEFASLVTLGLGVVAAGVIGGYGAAGGFSGGSSKGRASPTPISPSM